MLDVKRLRLLWELSARRTIASVAEALNYSPSAISQQLALLEQEAGVPLLLKSGRTLELTPAAEALVVATDALLSQLEQAEARLHESRDDLVGTIRIAVFQTAVLALMPGALRRLRRESPQLRVEMVQHEPEAAMHEVRARGFDLVVAEQYPGHAAPHIPGLERRALTRDSIKLALPLHGTGDDVFDHAGSLADAAKLPWVMEPRGAASRHWAEQACRVAGFEPDVRYQTADLQAHVRLVESGNAAALLPGLVHVGAVHRVRLVDLRDDPHRVVFTASRAAMSAHPALAASRRALLAEVENLSTVANQFAAPAWDRRSCASSESSP